MNEATAVTPANEPLSQAAKYAVGLGLGPLPREDPTKVVVAEVVEPGLLDMRAAQLFLSLSAPTVYAEMRAGRLHAVKFGRKPLFQLSELRRYAASLPAWEPK